MSTSARDAAAAPAVRVAGLLALYGDARASVAALLCDRHPAEAVAYTVIGPDLSATMLTYDWLREKSERFALPWPGWG
jgi:acetyl-CoA synthetase